jgi:hypothetical protein
MKLRARKIPGKAPGSVMIVIATEKNSLMMIFVCLAEG